MSKRSKRLSADGRAVFPVVLVVVDFPQPLTRALFYACRYASRRGCRLLLVHVRPRVDVNPLLFVRRALGQRSRDFAEKYVQEVSAKVQEWGCSLPSFSMLEGDTVEEIDKLLSDGDHRVGLIVLSESGFVSLSSSLLRSVSRSQSSRGGGGLSLLSRFPFVVVPQGLSQEDVEGLL